MMFVSYSYLVFLLVVVGLFWSLPTRTRLPLLIAASIFFYASWSWPYAFLLLATAAFNWSFGRYVLARPAGAPRHALALGIGANVLLLVYFKYTAFMFANVTSLLGLLGLEVALSWTSPALPLGISFFTFQGIAYLVDVAAGEKPMHRFRDFALFKALWPQLIAGPIVRLDEFRDQKVAERPDFDQIAAGGLRVLQGFAKKVMLADQLGPFVDQVFQKGVTPNAVDVVCGTLAFGMQIYFDFSGYTDIAIGSAKLVGYELPENFDWPYRATSPQQFWARWHMSLSRWIRDYVFTPLAFTFRRRVYGTIATQIAAMALCGLWHGASWTFVIWGAWHGVWLTLSSRIGLFSAKADGKVALRLAAWTATMVIVALGWLAFRAPTLAWLGTALQSLFTARGGLQPAILRENVILVVGLYSLAVYGSALGLMLWPAKERPRLRFRAFVFAATIVLIVILDREAQPFIYFQF